MYLFDWLRRSITGKMLLLTVLLSVGLWLSMDWFQERELRAAFVHEMTEELAVSSVDDRRLFDMKVRETSSAVRLITTQKRFVDYLHNLQQDWDGQITYHAPSTLPDWLPAPSIMRVFFNSRYALLLDAGNNLRDVYIHGGGSMLEQELPEDLLYPGILIHKLSHNPFILTMVDGFPYIIAAREVREKGRYQGMLLLASPLDSRYLEETVNQQNHNTILAIVDSDTHEILSSSNEEAVPSGSQLEQVEGYLQTGKSFFDYGASDLTVQLSSMIATRDVEQRIDHILQMNTRQRSILVGVLLAAFIGLSLWMSTRIKLLSQHVRARSQKLLGISVGQMHHDDELMALQYQVDRFANEVERVRSELKMQLRTQLILSDNLEDKNQHLESLNEQLHNAMEEARQANQAKSDFISAMSHEMRTPMNAILGFAQLLQDDANLSAEQHENIDDIIHAGQHLLDLINEVLDLAKIESGSINLHPKNLLFADIIAMCRKLVEPLAKKHQITLHIDESCHDDQYVYCDYLRVKQILLNLLSNAIKYNTAQGSVWMNCERGAEYLTIRVRDTGTGIEQSSLEKLFEAFNRLGAENSDIEGTGIGLLITRQLIEMMGGKLGIESKAGEGSTFWFTLPLGDSAQNTTATRQAGSLHPLMKLQTPSFGAGFSLLYIEDNQVNINLIQKLIKRHTDMEMHSALRPGEGLQLATDLQPDIILLDINLPGMSGYDVLQQLRSREPTREIPVIALTANARGDEIQKGHRAGFDGYLTKPIDIKQFIQLLENMLNGLAEKHSDSKTHKHS